MAHRKPFVRAAALLVVLCSQAWSVTADGPAPIDPDATPETVALFHNLRRIAQQDKILFGQYETLLYGLEKGGVRWERNRTRAEAFGYKQDGIRWESDKPEADSSRSDIKTAVEDLPAVYGWGFMNISARKQRIAARKSGVEAAAKVVEFRRQTGDLMVAVHKRGGINEMFWNMWHPYTGGYKATKHRAVRSLLPGGEHHEAFKADMDDVAAFMATLRDDGGRLIPIIWRPWHEHTGAWFWWGSTSCAPEEYIALWRLTVEYIRDIKGVHNLIWAYSPSDHGVGSTDAYEQNRFPGYEYLDLVGIDHYGNSPGKYAKMVVTLAEKHGKIPALTECGASPGGKHGLVKDKALNWYTGVFLKQMKADPVARRIAYAMVWRNANDGHFWIPYPGHPDVPDFKAFHADPLTVFENDLPDVYAAANE